MFPIRNLRRVQDLLDIGRLPEGWLLGLARADRLDEALVVGLDGLDRHIAPGGGIGIAQQARSVDWPVRRHLDRALLAIDAQAQLVQLPAAVRVAWMVPMAPLEKSTVMVKLSLASSSYSPILLPGTLSKVLRRPKTCAMSSPAP